LWIFCFSFYFQEEDVSSQIWEGKKLNCFRKILLKDSNSRKQDSETLKFENAQKSKKFSENLRLHDFFYCILNEFHESKLSVLDSKIEGNKWKEVIEIGCFRRDLISNNFFIF